MRALRRFDEESFVVKLPEGHQIAVPAWMLDAVFCSQLQQRDHPLIALEALLELAEFIELQRLPSSATDSESEPSSLRGGVDALRTQREIIFNRGWSLRERRCGKNFPNPVEFAAGN